jgi:NAD(P)-dependent dehydrogenase (short-subunit alcohol dehydrogenase family)
VSSTGNEPSTGHAAYGLAKGSLWLLTRYIAAEYGRQGIRANSICSGMIATGGSGAVAAAAPPTSMLVRTSLGRVGLSSEVVGAAVYFASDKSCFTSGQCLHVNGGRVRRA